MKIIKQELQFDESLKQRLEFICEFSKATPTFINGSIRKLILHILSHIERLLKILLFWFSIIQMMCIFLT